MGYFWAPYVPVRPTPRDPAGYFKPLGNGGFPPSNRVSSHGVPILRPQKKPSQNKSRLFKMIGCMCGKTFRAKIDYIGKCHDCRAKDQLPRN